MDGPFYVNTEARRYSAWGGNCASVPFADVTIDGRVFKCHAKVAEAFKAWEIVRSRFNYKLTGSDTGIYSCRHINHDSSNAWSAHSWATALDVNWLENPAGNKLVTDIPREMIRELQLLQTNSGAWVFMWGGDWDRDGISTDHSYVDAMHWEVIAHPVDLASGIKDVPTNKEGNMGLKSGDRGNSVGALQVALNDWKPAFNLRVDRIYGAATKAAVADYQEAAQLVVTGEADDTTLNLLFSNPFRNKDSFLRIMKRYNITL